MKRKFGFNTLKTRQNCLYFAGNISKCIFLYENVWISFQISQKFVPAGPINNIPALVQVMAWHWTGNKTLSEPMMVGLLMHISFTWPQWVKGPLLFRMKQTLFFNCILSPAIITENNTHNRAIHTRSFALLHSEWYVYQCQMYLYHPHIAIYGQYI